MPRQLINITDFAYYVRDAVKDYIEDNARVYNNSAPNGKYTIPITDLNGYNSHADNGFEAWQSKDRILDDIEIKTAAFIRNNRRKTMTAETANSFVVWCCWYADRLCKQTISYYKTADADVLTTDEYKGFRYAPNEDFDVYSNSASAKKFSFANEITKSSLHQFVEYCLNDINAERTDDHGVRNKQTTILHTDADCSITEEAVKREIYAAFHDMFIDPAQWQINEHQITYEPYWSGLEEYTLQVGDWHARSYHYAFTYYDYVGEQQDDGSTTYTQKSTDLPIWKLNIKDIGKYNSSWSWNRIRYDKTYEIPILSTDYPIGN